MKFDIFECQPGLFCRPTNEPDQAGYKFVCKRKDLYEFVTRDGKHELFARRQSYAGWHLKRGRYVYEFVRSLPAVNVLYMSEIEKLYSPGIGRHWFDPGSMRFFSSRLAEVGYQSAKGGPIYFVSSEQNSGAFGGPQYPRLYSVRKLTGPKGSVETVGEFQAYGSRASADKAAKRFAMFGEE